MYRQWTVRVSLCVYPARRPALPPVGPGTLDSAATGYFFSDTKNINALNGSFCSFCKEWSCSKSSKKKVKKVTACSLLGAPDEGFLLHGGQCTVGSLQ